MHTYKMWGACLLLYVVFGGLLVFVPYVRGRRGSVAFTLYFWTLTYAVWYLHNPMFRGAPRILKSTARNITDRRVVRNWVDTVSCEPTLVRAYDQEDVVRAVGAASHVRVVGGGHSWSPLVCTNDTLVVLEYCDIALDNHVVRASAGCTIQQVQAYLNPRGRMLLGYGSIMAQTLAGGSMTSLHGSMFMEFTAAVQSMTAVLANQSVVHLEGDALRYWKHSMGMLGVVTEMTLGTAPYSTVHKTIRVLPLETAMTQLHNDSLVGLTIVGYIGGAHTDMEVTEYADVQPTNTTVEIATMSPWFSFAFDNILPPAFILGSRVLRHVNLVPLTVSAMDARVPTINAWASLQGFGMKSAEYSVPLEHCAAALRRVQDVSRGSFVHLIVRKLQPCNDVLAFAPVASCMIEPTFMDLHAHYQTDMNAYHAKVENIIADYGGRTHWGKYYSSQFDKLNIPETFKDYRRRVDPDAVFMNDYTRALLDGGAYTYETFSVSHRGWIWTTLFWTTSAVAIVSGWWCARRSEYTPLTPVPLPWHDYARYMLLITTVVCQVIATNDASLVAYHVLVYLYASVVLVRRFLWECLLLCAGVVVQVTVGASVWATLAVLALCLDVGLQLERRPYKK